MKIRMKTNYNEDLRIFDASYKWVLCLILILFVTTIPVFAGNYLLYSLNLTGIYIIVALGLNLLTGYTGQISLGHAGFFAVGAYCSAALTTHLLLPFWLALPLSGLLAGGLGVIVGLPALRLKGLYLAIATMAFAFIIEESILQLEFITNGSNGISLPKPYIGSFKFTTYGHFYYITFSLVIVSIIAMKNIFRSGLGRGLVAIRDNEEAAECSGVHLAKYKTAAFAISAIYTGIAGSLFGHFMGFIAPDNFTLLESISFIVMILIGGLGTIIGSIFGAIFITFLPEFIRVTKDYLPAFIQVQKGLQSLVYGLILILFIIFEPNGLYGRWLKIKIYWEIFPCKKKEKY